MLVIITNKCNESRTENIQIQTNETNEAHALQLMSIQDFQYQFPPRFPQPGHDIISIDVFHTILQLG